MEDIFTKRHAMLVTEFDRYVMEHPDFAAKIPPNAQIILQLEDDEDYNNWSRQLAEGQHEIKQPIVYVHIKGLKPVHSRVQEAVLEIH